MAGMTLSFPYPAGRFETSNCIITACGTSAVKLLQRAFAILSVSTKLLHLVCFDCQITDFMLSYNPNTDNNKSASVLLRIEKMKLRLNSLQYLAMGFALIILTGAFLLWLPVANHVGLSFLDALLPPHRRPVLQVLLPRTQPLLLRFSGRLSSFFSYRSADWAS